MVTFRGGWTGPRQGVTITINAAPNIGQEWTLTGPDGFVTTNMMDAILTDLGAGDYTIDWSDVSGFVTGSYAAGPFTVGAGGSLVFDTPSYTPDAATGNAQVTVDDPGATWVLTASGYTSGQQTGNQTISNLAPDLLYTVTFNDNIHAKVAPAPDSGTVTTGNTLALSGSYVARSTFIIAVNTQQDGASAPADFGSWSITNDEGFAFVCAGDSDTNAPIPTPSVGDFFYTGRNYTLSFGSLGGYEAIADQAVSSAGTFFGNYVTVIQRGDVQVIVNDQTAQWVLTAPGYSSGTQTGTQTITQLPYGEYTATFTDNLIQYTMPAPDVGTLDSASLALAGIYAARTPIILGVDVQPVGVEGAPPEWVVTSVGAFTLPFYEAGSGDATLTGPVYQGRDYQILYSGVSGYTPPVPNPDTVTLGASHTFVGTYTPATPESINVVIQNAPQTTSWWLYDSSQTLVDSGAGDKFGITGSNGETYHVVWGWDESQEHWRPNAYDATIGGQIRANGFPTVADPGPQPFSSPTQTISGSAITFTGNYVFRGIVPVEQRRMGMNTNPQSAEYLNVWLFSDLMKFSGETPWVYQSNSDVPLDPQYNSDGWPTNVTAPIQCRFQPYGLDASGRISADGGAQPYRLYWRGRGSVQVDQSVSGGPSYTFNNLGDADDSQGVTGKGITLNPAQANAHKADFNSVATGHVRILSSSGADPIRDIELVHANLVSSNVGSGASQGLGNPATVDHRNFTKTFVIPDILRQLKNMNHHRLWHSPMGMVQPFCWSEAGDGWPWDGFFDGSVGDYTHGARKVQLEPGSWGWKMSYLSSQTLDSASSTAGTHRSRYRDYIDLCNAAGIDLWMQMPFGLENPLGGSQPNLRGIVEMVEAPYNADGTLGGGLHPGAHVYAEYDNEIWNTDWFAAGQWVATWGYYHANLAANELGENFDAMGFPAKSTPTSGFDFVAPGTGIEWWSRWVYPVWVTAQWAQEMEAVLALRDANTADNTPNVGLGAQLPSGNRSLKERWRPLLNIQIGYGGSIVPLGGGALDWYSWWYWFMAFGDSGNRQIGGLTIKDKAYGVAIAPYWQAAVSGPTVDPNTYFTSLFTQENENPRQPWDQVRPSSPDLEFERTASQMQDVFACRTHYNVPDMKITAYEGGWGHEFRFGAPDPGATFAQMLPTAIDTRMYRANWEYLKSWYELGEDSMFTYYNFSTDWNIYGFWGIKPSEMKDQESPRYQAWVDQQYLYPASGL